MKKNSTTFLNTLSVSSVIAFFKKHRYLTIAIISWIAMIVLTLLFLIPQIQLILSHATDLSIEEKKFADVKSQVIFLEGINKDELTAQSATLQSVLPVVKPVLPLISALEGLASQAQVSISGLELNPGKVATAGGTLETSAVQHFGIDGVYALPLKLEVEGQFLAMNTFFKSLDQVLPLVNIKSIQFSVLSSGGKGAVQTQYKAVIELESLYTLAAPPSKVVNISPLSTADKQLLLQLQGFGGQNTQSPAPLPAPVTPGTIRPSIFSY